ncbi:MAG: VWA domain-containing protein [Oligoflexia bacterium]|nr:VWA domain-containing protein [Oligoflexia bacterium]
MIQLADSWWLRMVWGALALFILALIIDGRAYKKIKKHFGEKADFLTTSVSMSRRRWHNFLQCLVLACFAIALARPLLGAKQTEVKQTGIEMIIAIDVSNSMLAEDDKPSRLAHAKHEISSLLDQLGGSRVGLIAFAGSAILVSPMTTDHGALKIYLNSLSPDSVSTQGTNLKDAIDEAMKAFERGGVEGLNGTKPTRVMLFASDGEDNEPGAINAAKKAVDQGLRIFGLGFGSAKGTPIPVRDDRGMLRDYKKDKSNQVIMTVQSDEVMGKLARAGGGSYYHATFEETEIKNLVADLNRLEKADFKSRMSTEFDEKFQVPLLLGLIFALLDLLFGDRRSDARAWRGRFEVNS